MTSRAEAAGHAEAWAERADRHATDYRDVSYAVFLTDPGQAGYHAALRVQAEAMALMWARIAKLLPVDICADRAPSIGLANEDADYPNFCTLLEGHRNPWHQGENNESWRAAESEAPDA